MAITTPHAELYTYPKSRWVEGHFFAVRKLFCAWEDRADLAVEVGTYPDSIYPYAEALNIESLAREIAFDPFEAEMGGSGGLASYGYAVLTVKYSTRGPKYVESVLIDEKLEPCQEYLRAGHKYFKWSVDNAQVEVDEAPKLVLAGLQYTRKVFQLSAIPNDALSYAWCVNSNDVVTPVLGKTFPAGTLLYAGATIHTRIVLGQAMKFDVDYRCLYRPQSWNKFFRSQTGLFEDIKLAKTGAVFRPYTPVSFFT